MALGRTTSNDVIERIVAMHADVRVVRERLDDVRTIVDRHADENAREFGELKRSISVLQDQDAAHRAAFEKGAAKMDALGARIDGINTRVDRIDTDVRSLRGSVDGLQSDIATTKARAAGVAWAGRLAGRAGLAVVSLVSGGVALLASNFDAIASAVGKLLGGPPPTP